MTPDDLECLWQDLWHVTQVRVQVLHANDVVTRLFATTEERKMRPTWNDLSTACDTFEEKYPGFYLWYSPVEGCFGLFPYSEPHREVTRS